MLTPQGYDPLILFKCLLIGQWHGLSDPELERALKVRLDFMVFCGLGLHASVPDETTHCRFRNALVKGGVYDDLPAEVCRQIEGHGLKLKEASAAIIDATLIESAARPRNHIDPPQERAEDEAPDAPDVHFSADPDARWVKKGSKSTLGFKGFARADEEGYIDRVHTTPANKAESPEFDTMVEGAKAQRFRVEQGFGTMKRLFGLHRARYFGLARTHAQIAVAAIGQNLLKAANKITLTPQDRASPVQG
jgi:IS5 family transposase